MPKKLVTILVSLCVILYTGSVFSLSQQEEERHEAKFKWWPSDATPGPVKDEDKGGYWWWPTTPGEVRPWGNRGYVYVYKIIFDYKEEELGPRETGESRPSLLVRKIIKNVKVYFDYDKAALRDDALLILQNAVKALNKNPESSILITGNCDRRGQESYNLKLGRARADAVRNFMLDNGVAEDRIKIVSRGKLDAIASITDLFGMQKDRNAQFMIAEVEEVEIPYTEALAAEARKTDDGKYLIEEEEDVKSMLRVSTRKYIVKEGDTLGKIAAKEYGGAHRWKYLYELNKDTIKDPDKLTPGQTILIPVE